MTRSTREVIDHHLRAVDTLVPSAMAADYAPDAELVRGDACFRRRDAILGYFETVPERLAGGRVVVQRVDVAGERGTIWWRLVGGPADGLSGHDDIVVHDGLITRQSVHLDGTDF